MTTTDRHFDRGQSEPHTADVRAGFMWRLERAPAPDRVRSFLIHLAELRRPLRFAELPANLYMASEALAAGEEAECSLTPEGGQPRRCTMRAVLEDSRNEVILDLGPLQGLDRALLSPLSFDLLAAGARMLGCRTASLIVSVTVGTHAGSEVESVVLAPIALWASGQSAGDTNATGMAVIREDWDGAILLLAAPSAAPDPWPMWSALLQSVFDERTRASVLERVFRSSDWRLRVAAMIETARRGIRSLGLEVKRMEIPSTSTPGVDSALRHHLLAMQKASMLLLAGEPVPDLGEESADTRSGMRAHVLRAIAGRPLAFRDEFAEIVDSLVGPAQ